MSAPIKADAFTTGITPVNTETLAEIMESVIARGDLSKLTDEERTNYYLKVCETAGLNPITQPFQYITLNGRLTLYARKDATDQLRRIHKVSVVELTETVQEGVFVVTAKVVNAEGRTDAAKGAVNIAGLKGDALANSLMKCETKAKRRATLSICGLGFLDETEIETIPAAAKEPLKTLAKKDARPMYSRMQAELYACNSIDELKAWGEAVAERVKSLPEDWQDVLRVQYEESKLAMRQALANATEVSHDADGVIWEETAERPMTSADVLEPRPIIGNFTKHPTKPTTQRVEQIADPLDIPAYLRRTTPTASDIEETAYT